MEDDKRRPPFATEADGLLLFEFIVTAEIWMGKLAKGSAALASYASSSDDMPFSGLGSSALISVLHGVSVLHGISSAPPSYFSDDGENRGTGLKELTGRELRSGVRRSSSFRFLPTPNGSCGSSGG